MRPEQNRKSLKITLAVINGYPRRKKRELYIKTRVVIAFMLSRKVRGRIDADAVSADICVYDPSGISDARKRERGKCHMSCPKGTPPERRAKWKEFNCRRIRKVWLSS